MAAGLIGRYRIRWFVGALTVVLAAIVASSGALAASRCKHVEGKFTLESVNGPTCTSSIGLCVTGVYRGDVSGTSFFVGTSVIQTVDTPTTAVVLVTGDNAIRTRAGTLSTKDAIVLRTTGAGEFAEVDTIVGGTGALTGVTGVLRAQGTFAGGRGSGEYVGQVCSQ